uniref:Uncharacterized protein n=1 Tax=Sphingomonas sp. JE1 TaxID=1628059 RepID=A0A0D4ZZB6_9SPHN|nr:hypothetical protein pJE1_077 [Sphingomonas sp. JE1]
MAFSASAGSPIDTIDRLWLQAGGSGHPQFFVYFIRHVAAYISNPDRSNAEVAFRPPSVRAGI